MKHSTLVWFNLVWFGLACVLLYLILLSVCCGLAYYTDLVNIICHNGRISGKSGRRDAKTAFKPLASQSAGLNTSVARLPSPPCFDLWVCVSVVESYEHCARGCRSGNSVWCYISELP